MAKLHDFAYLGDKIIPFASANLSVASAAVLYGLSVYTVFPISKTSKGLAAFRLADHYERLCNSARIMGIDGFEREWGITRFTKVVAELVKANSLAADALCRVSVHVDALLPGTRSRGLSTVVSMFIYEAPSILSPEGSRLAVSSWRRVADDAIPARAKVNGAYVNSVLGKQDALDAGADDCIFLDRAGNVCELSAANIFLVRDGVLITPSSASDILEGITRKTILELARDLQIPSEERAVALTELFVADEVFASGTSTLTAPVLEIDKRVVGSGAPGPLTMKLRDALNEILHGTSAQHAHLLTPLV